jgi:SAM-dependent methyltransferase
MTSTDALSSSRLTEPLCPVCRRSSRFHFEKYQHSIYKCDHCHHEFVVKDLSAKHAAAVYGDDYFSGGGAGYPDYLAEAEILKAHGRRYAKLLRRYIPRPGRMFDVGAAAGFVLSGFIREGWQGEGTEPNGRMADHARSVLGLQVSTGPLEQMQQVPMGQDESWVAAHDNHEMPDPLMGQSSPSSQAIRQASSQPISQPISQPTFYDLINLVQVLPHLYDLDNALQIAAAMTRPGGYWLIETWNRDSLTARMSGQGWHEYSPPSVLHWFSPEGVELLGERYGFTQVAQGRPQKWIGGAHGKSLVRYKVKGTVLEGICNLFLKLIPDRIAVPYPAEDLFWILLKKDDA